MIASTFVPKHTCPTCHRILDMVTSVDSPMEIVIPSEGDMTICIKCGTVCIFKSDGQLRCATTEECELHLTPRAKQLIDMMRKDGHNTTT
jgi:hypothetical protein